MTTPTPSNVRHLLYAVNCTWQWQLWSRDIHTISRYMYIFNPIFDHPHRTLARWDYHKSYKSKLGWWNTKHAVPQIGMLLFWSITSNSKTGLGRILQRVNHRPLIDHHRKRFTIASTLVALHNLFHGILLHACCTWWCRKKTLLKP